jgi:hypothetical protein
MEQQGLEALNLRTILHEDQTAEYIKGKKHLDDRDKQQIFSMPKEIRSK